MANTILHLCASNDDNGNPRRCFVVLSADGFNHVVGVYDEGYLSFRAVPEKYRKNQYPVVINVTVQEYERWMAMGANLDPELCAK